MPRLLTRSIARHGCAIAQMLVLSFVVSTAGHITAGHISADEMDIVNFGRLPARFNGRVTTLDTVARNFLKRISDREVADDADDRSQPAIRWLLDLMTSEEAASGYRIFRIEQPKLLDLFELPARKEDASASRYSFSELKRKFEQFEPEVKRVKDSVASRRNDYEREVATLNDRLHILIELKHAVHDIEITDQEVALATMNLLKTLNGRSVPLLLPPTEPGQAWQPLARGNLELYAAGQIEDFKANPAAAPLHSLLTNYRQHDAAAFNRSLTAYREQLTASGVLESPFDFTAPKGWLEFGTPAGPKENYYADARTYGATVVWMYWPAGDDLVTIRVTHFGRETAGMRTLVNDWRISQGLIPLDEQQFAKSTVATHVGGLPGIQGELVTPRNVLRPRERTVYTICERDGGTWVFTLSGPLELVNQHERDFLEFLRSVKIADNEKVASWVAAETADELPPVEGLHLLAAVIPDGDRTWVIRMTIGGDSLVERREPFMNFLKSLRFAPVANTASPIAWALPEGWRQVEDPQNSYATLEIPDERGPVEIVVQPLGGDEKMSILALLNHWQGFLQAKPLDESDLRRVTEDVEFGKRSATLIHLQSRPRPE